MGAVHLYRTARRNSWKNLQKKCRHYRPLCSETNRNHLAHLCWSILAPILRGNARPYFFESPFTYFERRNETFTYSKMQWSINIIRLNNRYYWFCIWKQNYFTYHYLSQTNTVFSGALNVATFRVALRRNCSGKKKNQQCPYTSWKVVLEQGSDMKSK